MKLPVSDASGKKLGEFELKEGLLEFDKGQQVLHQAVVAYQANQRLGAASTKSRGDVRGSGAKPWKQKGLGRARVGDRKSPIWRGGGVAFGPHPKSYNKNLNKKAARLAFKRAFSEKVAAGAVEVIDAIAITEPKTSLVAVLLKNLKVEKTALLVVDRVDDNLALAVRNIPNAAATSAARLNAYDLLRYNRIIVSKDAMATLESRLETKDSKVS